MSSLRAGRSYVEDVRDDRLAHLGRLEVASDHQLLRAADVVVIAVPTPLRDGSPDLSLVRRAASQVVPVLRRGQLVVLESTTYPGTTEEVLRPILEQNGLVAGRDFALAYSPERIDPGSGRSFRNTPKIVAGVTPADSAIASSFYAAMVDRIVVTSTPREAEMAKLIENTFRQVNIALVNELATIAPALGVNLWEALDAAATKPFGYLPFWPGPGVGGHCIAIDPTYLSWRVEQHLGFGIGFIEHARAVNNRMPAYVAARVGEALNRMGRPLQGARIVLVGLAYKPGVDDVRESPALVVLERLLASGARIVYHDPHVPSIRLDRRRSGDVLRADREVILSSRPLDPRLLAASDCAVILTAHPDVDYDVLVASSPMVFDATGITRSRRDPKVVLL